MLFIPSSYIIAGGCLWSLVLYLSLTGLREWIIARIEGWFKRVEQFFYISQENHGKKSFPSESINSFYASIYSISPFLLLGFFVNNLVELSLGKSWGISLGVLATVSCGIYQLGKRDNNREKE